MKNPVIIEVILVLWNPSNLSSWDDKKLEAKDLWAGIIMFISRQIIGTQFYTPVLPMIQIEECLNIKNKSVNGFTKKYNVSKLVYFEEFKSPEEAITAEKRIKGWIRKKKIELIKSSNPDLRDLLET